MTTDTSLLTCTIARPLCREVEELPARPPPLELFPHADAIARLWSSAAVQAAYEERSRFQLVQCANYFLTRVHIVLRENYLPSDQDVVQARVRTTGIVEHDFVTKNGATIILVRRSNQASYSHMLVITYNRSMWAGSAASARSGSTASRT